MIFNPQYVQFALNKLQHKEKLQWSQYVIQNHITQSNLIIFNTWLRDFALVCDHMPADIPTNSRTTQQQEHHPKVINRPPNTSTSNHNRPQQTCPFDKQSHHPSIATSSSSLPASKMEARPRPQLVLELSRTSFRQRLPLKNNV